MNIVMKKIKEILPYENNPRKNDNAVDSLANSIKEFGFKVPIIIDKKNIIVAGHTRLKAARKLKLEEVPCIVADDLTEEQIKAFRLVDNRTGELALWDYEKLNKELEELSNFDMSVFSFETEEVLEESKNNEIDIKEFGDDKFEKTCPRCGFKFS